MRTRPESIAANWSVLTDGVTYASPASPMRPSVKKKKKKNPKNELKKTKGIIFWEKITEKAK
jgi:hypothetical protein